MLPLVLGSLSVKYDAKFSFDKFGTFSMFSQESTASGIFFSEGSGLCFPGCQ